MGRANRKISEAVAKFKGDKNSECKLSNGFYSATFFPILGRRPDLGSVQGNRDCNASLITRGFSARLCGRC